MYPSCRYTQWGEGGWRAKKKREKSGGGREREEEREHSATSGLVTGTAMRHVGM
jgi:hypothetical protein